MSYAHVCRGWHPHVMRAFLVASSFRELPWTGNEPRRLVDQHAAIDVHRLSERKDWRERIGLEKEKVERESSWPIV